MIKGRFVIYSAPALLFAPLQMPSTSPKPAIQRAASTGGWLEVSIDSTLPASPVGISKNAFDLSHLEKHLPKWKPGLFTRAYL